MLYTLFKRFKMNAGCYSGAKRGKRCLLLVIPVCISLLFPSCTDWLEIKPFNQMVKEDFWKTSADVDAVMLSCYRAMQENEFMNWVVWGGELRSDNTAEGLDIQKWDRLIFNADIHPDNELISWTAFYRVINYCNTVLKLAPGVLDEDPDFTPGILHAREAEALTLRALSYFYLVRLYRNVPFVTEPSLDDMKSFKVEQTPENEILNRLVEDLKQAETYALKFGATPMQSKGRITKNAVRALLADIYLWQSKYAECVDACNRILAEVMSEEEYAQADKDLLTGSELRLVTTRNLTSNLGWSYCYSQIFGSKNASESIFELQFSSQEKANEAVNTIYGAEEIGKGKGRLSSSPFDEWPLFLRNEDVRKKDSYKPKSGGIYRIFKYLGMMRTENSIGTGTYEYRTSSNSPNWIFYRIPDVLLMKAEALVELGGENNLKDAITMVNQTYMRSNPDLAPRDSLSFSRYSSKDNMRSLVFDERQREFLFEGKRWFDLLRRVRREDNNPRLVVATFLSRKYSSSSGSKASNTLTIFDAWYLPIPKREMEVNPLLKQSPYYQSIADSDGTKK